MPNVRLIALNGNAGAFVNVLATIPVTRFEYIEDDAAAATGLQVNLPYDNFASLNTVSAAHEPQQVPNFTSAAARRGALLGIPAQGQVGAFNARAADKLLAARGNAAGATTLRFTEYE